MVRMGARQVSMGWENASEKSRLNSLLFLSTIWVLEDSLGLLGLMVKVHNLCRVKTKYLAVSPVTDNSSSWSRMSTEAPNISISLSKTWWVNKGRRDYGFHAILSQTFEENVLQSVRQNWLLCKTALKLHQPNMHIGYRVIPLSVHIVSLARSIFNGIWPTLLQNFILLQIVLTTSEFR